MSFVCASLSALTAVRPCLAVCVGQVNALSLSNARRYSGSTEPSAAKKSSNLPFHLLAGRPFSTTSPTTDTCYHRNHSSLARLRASIGLQYVPANLRYPAMHSPGICPLTDVARCLDLLRPRESEPTSSGNPHTPYITRSLAARAQSSPPHPPVPPFHLPVLPAFPTSPQSPVARPRTHARATHISRCVPPSRPHTHKSTPSVGISRAWVPLGLAHAVLRAHNTPISGERLDIASTRIFQHNTSPMWCSVREIVHLSRRAGA